MRIILIISSLVVLTLEGVLHSGAQCLPRDNAAARAIGRRCKRTVCTPQSESCSGKQRCICDYECGYSCINTENTCRAPPKIPNMERIIVSRKSSNGTYVRGATTPFRYDDALEYVCKPGYKRAEPVMSHLCHSRRRWTGTTTCVLACRRRSLYRARRRGMTCGVMCNSDNDCSGSLKCRCDNYCGRSCLDPAVSCGPAPMVENSDVRYKGEGFQQVATYSCHDGFFVYSGMTAIGCSGGGTWVGTPPSCRAITCGDPTVAFESMRGEVLDWTPGPFMMGYQLRFRCRPFHKMIGPSIRTCMGNGQWSGENTVCDIRDEKIRCPHPGVPINGRLRVRSDFSIGSKVVFACDDGYAMVGEETQECLYFLQWSGEGAPICIDPRYPEDDSEALNQLRENVFSIQASFQQQGNRFSRSFAGREENIHEIYFLFDISREVSEFELEDSLQFASEWAKMVDKTGAIKAAIFVFASEADGILELTTTFSDDVIKAFNDIRINRQNLNTRLGYERNTYAGVARLNTSFASSYEENNNRKRIVFLIVNGKRTLGPPPSDAVRSMADAYGDDLIHVYVVTFGDGKSEVAAYTELQAVAEPFGLFISNPSVASFQTIFNATNDFADFTKCGKSKSTEVKRVRIKIGKVVGGIKSEEKSWPWQALVTFYNPIVFLSYEAGRVLGGATLINRQWLLTAAHLFDRLRQIPRWEENLLFTLGITDRVTTSNGSLPMSARVFDAERIVLHHNFSNFDYDVALVRLGNEYYQDEDLFKLTGRSGSVNFTSFIRPVCLPCMEDSCAREYLRSEGLLTGATSSKERCEIEGNWLLPRYGATEDLNVKTLVTGFGHTMNLDPDYDFLEIEVSPFLNEGLIRMKNDTRCRRARDHMNLLQDEVQVTDRMICGIGEGGFGGIDACPGDSGGPLLREVTNGNESCWVQIGIVSWGYGCGQRYVDNRTPRFFPGYYTNVASVVQWIKSMINPEREILCDVPQPPQFGRVSSPEESLPVNSTITFHCDQGYSLIGQSTDQLEATCRSDSTWSVQTPQCAVTISPCSPNPCQNGGTCVNQDDSYLCLCSSRYEGKDCSTNKECMVSDPPDFASIVPQVSRVAVGDNITYVCDESYKLSHRAGRRLSVTCLDDKTFTRRAPHCIRGVCIVPEAPEFGSILTSQLEVVLGESITYVCDNGYEMVGVPKGRSERICQSSGNWSLPSPQCQRITCPHRNASEFAVESSTNSSGMIGDIVTYECSEGFRLNGPSRSRCLSDGSWNNPVPTCSRITCFNRPIPQRAEANPQRSSWFVGDVVTYSCNAGNDAIGATSSTCLSDGSWNNPVPTCSRQVTCLVPPPQLFALISTNRATIPPGDSIEFICDEGHIIRGQGRRFQSTITCQDDGTWSDKPPECTRITCPNRPIPQRAEANPQRSPWFVGDVVTYSCNAGYDAIGATSSTCLSNGSWNNPVPICLRQVTCLVPPPPLFGSISTNQATTPSGGIIEFTCDEGHVIYGPGRKLQSTITCQDNGTWSDEPPECTRITCPNRATPQHAEANPLRSSWFVGDVVTYSCNAGYDAVGMTSSTCLSDGSWNNPVPTCLIQSCPRVTNADIRNGNTVGSVRLFRPGESVRFACDAGYRLLGLESLVCREDLLWSDAFPVCVQIARDRCPTLAPPKNGRIEFHGHGDYQPESFATFFCREGFRLKGSSSTICLDTFVWTHAVPKCEEVGCIIFEPMIPPRVRILGLTGLAHPVGDTLQVECSHPLQELNNNPRMTCVGENRWKPDIRDYRCLSFCLAPSLPDSIKIVGGYQEEYRAGSRISFACVKRKETVVGEKVLVCKRNGDWNRNPPTACETKKIEKMYCPEALPPQNGAIIGSTGGTVPVLSGIKFVCNLQYEMLGHPSGVLSATCLSNGTWSAATPRCIKINPCEIDPCRNGGICRRRKIGYSCDCLSGTSGRNCETVECGTFSRLRRRNQTFSSPSWFHFANQGFNCKWTIKAKPGNQVQLFVTELDLDNGYVEVSDGEKKPSLRLNSTGGPFTSTSRSLDLSLASKSFVRRFRVVYLEITIGGWSRWTRCSSTCRGRQFRRRTCSKNATGCSPSQTRPCNTRQC